MIDDSSQLNGGATLHAEVCIIGAGAAGITLALELAGTGISVLLLESGGLVPEPETQSLYQGAVADDGEFVRPGLSAQCKPQSQPYPGAERCARRKPKNQNDTGAGREQGLFGRNK